MLVRGITLKNYRNYGELSLAFDPNINIFLGANAQGKTNIIEAVYYASLGRSHRTHQDTDLIRWEAPAASLRLAYERLGVENTLEIAFVRGKRRKITLNGQVIRPKELVGGLNTVFFSPEDLFLIKGAPAGRRHFLDAEISQASPAYYHELLQYNHIVQQRNGLLKRIRERHAPAAMLDIWDAQLAASAAKIVTKRLEAVRKLHMLANLMQRRISGNQENLSVTYEIHGAGEQDVTKSLVSWYNKELAEKRELDILRGVTSRGPHRDDLKLAVNEVDLRAFGSQGQQRTGVLSLKLAELEFLRSETGEYPVLLLDDVMSELDADRRRLLMDFIRKEHIQTMITATDAAYFPHGLGGACFAVQAGRVRQYGKGKEDGAADAAARPRDDKGHPAALGKGEGQEVRG